MPQALETKEVEYDPCPLERNDQGCLNTPAKSRREHTKARGDKVSLAGRNQ